jgi:hypothetical protein
MDASAFAVHRRRKKTKLNNLAANTVEERRLIIAEGAVRLQLNAVIVEKDFWVCWMLSLLFGRKEWSEALVFKGGTALSKVFRIIRRFSEDIDLSVSPAALGISEADVEQAASRRQRDEWMKKLEVACGEWVQQQMQPELERTIQAVIGKRSGGKPWLEYQTDAAVQSPVLLFHYPSAVESGLTYIRRWVKLEFGSLTDQRPANTYRVIPWLAEELPAAFSQKDCEVVALEVERAFWEKATILHAEHHRDLATPMPQNYSRHYADVGAMAGRPEAERAIEDMELLARVVHWKARFFARSWARYDLADFGTFCILPPKERLPELKRDYEDMREMFLDPPIPFGKLFETLADLERRINRRR